ncbi:uncharacterized protein LOC125305004 [Alosa alosa]|nr:uncharacterized protein LOC125305004 [Alosa alosa]
MKEEGAAQETFEVEQFCHSKSKIDQALGRMQDFLREETGEIDTLMKSLRHINQSVTDRSQCRIKCLPKDFTDREMNNNDERSTEVNQEHLTTDQMEIKQRFNALKQKEMKLQCQLIERNEEFEMEKIVLERERVHERMDWDRYMQEREAALLSTVMSVMIKRKKMMEELRNQVVRESTSNTKRMEGAVKNCCGTRRKWWSFRKFENNIPRRWTSTSRAFKNKCECGRHTDNRGQTSAAANQGGLLQVGPAGEVIPSQHSDPSNGEDHTDSTVELIRQKELKKIAIMEKRVRGAEMKRQAKVGRKAKKTEKKRRKKEMKTSAQMEDRVKDVTLREHAEQNELKIAEQEKQKGLGILHRMGWNTHKRGIKSNKTVTSP